MHFGIFYGHQLPRPWREGDAQRLFQEALDQVEVADRLGFDYAWEVEHHFAEECSHSSAPEVFLAAYSQSPESHEREAERQKREMERLAPHLAAAMKRKRWMQPLADEDIEEFRAYGRNIGETQPLLIPLARSFRRLAPDRRAT